MELKSSVGNLVSTGESNLEMVFKGEKLKYLDCYACEPN